MADRDMLEAAWTDYLAKIPSGLLASRTLGLMRFAFLVGAAYAARFIERGADATTLAKEADTKADATIADNRADFGRLN